MKKIIFLILIFGTAKIGVSQSRVIYQVDSLMPHSLSPKKIRKIRKEYDKIIKDNLTGSWQFHGGNLIINKKGVTKFYYLDTLRNSMRWEVKNGVITSSRTETIGSQGLYFTSRHRFRVLYSSPDSLAFIIMQESSNNKILTAKKIFK